jgi:hypothetical protein
MEVHFGFIFSRKRSMLVALVTFLALAAGPSADVRAGIILSIQSVTASDDAFDVFLTNTGLSAVHIDTTQFEITASSAQVNLTSATVSTTLYPYIFGANSLFGPVINTSSGQTLDASDAITSGDVSIGANSSVGLGHIFFTVTGTLSSPATISFNTNPNFTSLADLGNNVPIDTFQSGTISSVPEPASIVQIAVAVLLGGLLKWRRRIRRTS